MPTLGFLNTNQRLELPVGGDFLPSGFVGALYAQNLFSFMSQIDSKNGEYPEMPPYEARTKAGDWGFKYYYKTKSAADVAMEMLGVQPAPGAQKPNAQNVWLWSIDRDSVLNFADKTALEKFPNPITFDVNITSMKSKKRHEFHMLALPFAVQAVAKYMGYLKPDDNIFHVTELLGQDVAFTDDLKDKMVGSFDAKKEDDAYFTNSILWQRRADLWRALGESDAGVYQPIGAEKMATASEKLSNCLQIVAAPWNASVWGRLANVPDPRVDAKYEDKEGKEKHQNIAVLMELFADKAAAQKAADVDVERSKKNQAAKAAPTNGAVPHTNGKLIIPQKWIEGDVAEMWAAKAMELKAEYPALPSAPKLAQLAKANDATVEELKSIWA